MKKIKKIHQDYDLKIWDIYGVYVLTVYVDDELGNFNLYGKKKRQKNQSAGDWLTGKK